MSASGSGKKPGGKTTSGGIGNWFTCAQCGKRLPRSASAKHADADCGDAMYPHILDYGKETASTCALLVNATTTSSKNIFMKLRNYWFILPIKLVFLVKFQRFRTFHSSNVVVCHPAPFLFRKNSLENRYLKRSAGSGCHSLGKLVMATKSTNQARP